MFERILLNPITPNPSTTAAGPSLTPKYKKKYPNEFLTNNLEAFFPLFNDLIPLS